MARAVGGKGGVDPLEPFPPPDRNMKSKRKLREMDAVDQEMKRQGVKKLSRKDRRRIAREHEPPGIAFKRAACKFLKIRMATAPSNIALRERCIVALDLKPHECTGLVREGYEDIIKMIDAITDPANDKGWNPIPFDADHAVLPDIEEPNARQSEIDAFYESWEWKRCRYDFLKDKKRTCQCCGASASDGVRIVVDHVKPIRRFWRLRLDPSNLQILCDDCNMGKGSRDYTDWRVA